MWSLPNLYKMLRLPRCWVRCSIVRRLFLCRKWQLKRCLEKWGKHYLLEGRKVQPTVASNIGFEYRYADLEQALRFELGKFTSMSTVEKA